MKKRKNKRNFLYSGIILILLVVMLYSGLRILESTVFRIGDDTQGFVSRTIVRDGVEYYPRQDITVVMILGIDKYGAVEDSGTYNNTGAADMVMLLVFDETEETCTLVHVNRDTMLEMPVLGVGGKEAGTYYGQLALSHTYGSGLADSCENTRKAVSNFFYGLEINYYVAMHMDAIAVLNDAVGGVTVNVEEDFSAVDPEITMGEFTLRGQQAITFVRSRQGVGDQLNVSRIERQNTYMNAFLDAFRKKWKSEHDFVLDAYDDASDYMVTDCSASALAGMVDRYDNYDIGEVVTIEGENTRGETYYEFYADEEKLDELILRLFYAPKQK